MENETLRNIRTLSGKTDARSISVGYVTSFTFMLLDIRYHTRTVDSMSTLQLATDQPTLHIFLHC